MNPDLAELLEAAYALGVSEAALIPSSQIRVSDQLALKCIQPRCENYGLSYSCPPYVEGPQAFRKLIGRLPQALVIRLILPSSILLSWERLDAGVVLHEQVATLEREAIQLGYPGSMGFAGGSCKELFCQDHLSCRRIEGGTCRHPDLARPSLSGYGVDVFKLVESCGWQAQFEPSSPNGDQESLAWVAGLVLIG